MAAHRREGYAAVAVSYTFTCGHTSDAFHPDQLKNLCDAVDKSRLPVYQYNEDCAVAQHRTFLPLLHIRASAVAMFPEHLVLGSLRVNFDPNHLMKITWKRLIGKGMKVGDSIITGVTR